MWSRLTSTWPQMAMKDEDLKEKIVEATERLSAAPQLAAPLSAQGKARPSGRVAVLANGPSIMAPGAERPRSSHEPLFRVVCIMA